MRNGDLEFVSSLPWVSNKPFENKTSPQLIPHMMVKHYFGILLIVQNVSGLIKWGLSSWTWNFSPNPLSAGDTCIDW